MKSEYEQFWTEILASFMKVDDLAVSIHSKKVDEVSMSLVPLLARHYTTDRQITEVARLCEIPEGDVKKKLHQAGSISEIGHKLSRVVVEKTPDGPAPDAVREQWVGVQLPVLHVPASEIGEINFISGEPVGPRDAVVTLVVPALIELAKNSEPAADWFWNNFPGTTLALSFGQDEVKVLQDLKEK